jgi:hypothetical protein
MRLDGFSRASVAGAFGAWDSIDSVTDVRFHIIRRAWISNQEDASFGSG